MLMDKMSPRLEHIGVFLCMAVITLLEEASGGDISSTTQSIQRPVSIKPVPVSMLGMCLYEPSVFKATIIIDGLKPPLTIDWFVGNTSLKEEHCSSVETMDPQKGGIVVSTCKLNVGDKNGWTNITCRASNSTHEVSGNLSYWHSPTLRNLFCPLVLRLTVVGALYFIVVICAVGYSLIKKYRRMAIPIYESVVSMSGSDAAQHETLREAVTSFMGRSPPVRPKPRPIASLFNNDEGDYLIQMTEEYPETPSCLMNQYRGMGYGAWSVEQLYDFKGKKFPIYESIDSLIKEKPTAHAPLASLQEPLYENIHSLTLTDKFKSIVPLLATDTEGYLLPTRKDHHSLIEYEQYSPMDYEMSLEQNNQGMLTDCSVSSEERLGDSDLAVHQSKIFNLNEVKPLPCYYSARCKKPGVGHSPTATAKSQSTVPLITTDDDGYLLPVRNDPAMSPHCVMKHNREMDWWTTLDQRIGDSRIPIYQSIWSWNWDKPLGHAPLVFKKHLVGHSPTANPQSKVPSFNSDVDSCLTALQNNSHNYPSPSVKRSRSQVRTFSAKATHFTFPRSLPPDFLSQESKQRTFQRSFSPKSFAQEPPQRSLQRSSSSVLSRESKKRSFQRSRSAPILIQRIKKTYL